MVRVSCLSGWAKLAIIPLASVLAACGGGGGGSSPDSGDDPIVALSASYKVEYVGSNMGEMVGKNTFTLRISNRSDGSAAGGETVSLMPMMDMGMMHATPEDGCSETATAGDYTCTVYYNMASEMGGMPMGDWELEVMIGGMMGESVTFNPTVMMAMGDTAMAKLMGMDLIPGDTPRTYYLFKDGMASTDSFSLFIAAHETMMSNPALYETQTLNATTLYELSIDTVTVELSTDDGNTWGTASNTGGNGHWSISGLGLTAGQANELWVRLTVNGETKTANGTDHQIFTVTP